MPDAAIKIKPLLRIAVLFTLIGYKKLRQIDAAAAFIANINNVIADISFFRIGCNEIQGRTFIKRLISDGDAVLCLNENTLQCGTVIKCPCADFRHILLQHCPLQRLVIFKCTVRNFRDFYNFAVLRRFQTSVFCGIAAAIEQNTFVAVNIVGVALFARLQCNRMNGFG